MNDFAFDICGYVILKDKMDERYYAADEKAFKEAQEVYFENLRRGESDSTEIEVCLLVRNAENKFELTTHKDVVLFGSLKGVPIWLHASED